MYKNKNRIKNANLKPSIPVLSLRINAMKFEGFYFGVSIFIIVQVLILIAFIGEESKPKLS